VIWLWKESAELGRPGGHPTEQGDNYPEAEHELEEPGMFVPKQCAAAAVELTRSVRAVNEPEKQETEREERDAQLGSVAQNQAPLSSVLMRSFG